MYSVQRILLGSFSLIVFGVLRQAAYAQTSKPTEPTQQPPVQSLLEQIKSTVLFLQAPYLRVETRVENGVPQTRQVPDALLGTAFLISVQEPRLGEGQGILYLVTNKHMIRAPGPDGKIGEGPYLNKVLARINTKQVMPSGSQSGIIDITVLDAMGSLEWFISNDETVDLAITPISLDSNQLDFKTIQTDLFATKDVLAKERISENDEILFTGLFAW